MEQLPIDSYMLLCKKKNSFSINQQIVSFKFDGNLKLVSAIFYQIFIFSPTDSPLKTMKNVFYFIQHFQIQKDKWKWNNLCHRLSCINLQM